MPTDCSRSIVPSRIRARTLAISHPDSTSSASFDVRKLSRRRQNVDRLEQIRLALPVVARDDVEPRPELEVDATQVAKRTNAQRLYRERDHRSDAHRHHDGEELPSLRRVDDRGIELAAEPS
jgi:hypothetical protein